MPIKGWCDTPRIPRIGKIHLGVRTENDRGKTYPKAVDYFVVKPDESTSEAAAKAFHSVYGETPREITIAFPTNDPEQFFPQYLAAYQGGGGKYKLYCSGDGETAQRADGKGGRVQIQCAYKDCPIYQAGKCKELGRLQFFLPEVPGIGVWQIDTSSFHTTSNLNGAIQMIRALTGGRIAMMPLKLRIVPKVVNPDGQAKTVYVLTLGIEDMRLTDFLRQTPMLAVSPSVEPIQREELPEDLFIEDNLIHEDTATNEEDTLDAASSVQDELSIGAVIDIEVKANALKKDVLRLRLATLQGECIELLTDEPKLIEALKHLNPGTAIQYASVPSSKWRNRTEIVDFTVIAGKEQNECSIA